MAELCHIIDRAGDSAAHLWEWDANGRYFLVRGDEGHKEVRLPDETVAARWCLLSNLPAEVTAETLVLWYYWRWRVESYFKLLKSHGWQVEQWQQEDAEAICKRLCVVALACVVVWQLQRAQTPEAERTRTLLLRLSGRQVRRGQATAPAMLAGLWSLLSVLDALEHYDLDELKQIAQSIKFATATNYKDV